MTVSVVVPIYKVEKYLHRCLRSLLEQTYKNIQIIAVDDGSPDLCGEICEEYAASDARIKVIHKKNGGLSDARNAGLQYADGDFVFYLDSDDYLETDAIERLLDLQKRTDADIAAGNYFYTYSGYEKVSDMEYKGETVLENYDAMEALVTGKIQNFAWGKLIRTEIAKTHLFPVGKLFEDTYWTHLVFADAKRVVVTNMPLIHYRQREDSISYEYNIKRLDVLEGWLARSEFLEQYYPTLAEPFLRKTAENYAEMALLILTKMKGEKKQAFSRLKQFNSQICLQKYAFGSTKYLIGQLDKGVWLYKLSAYINKILTGEAK